MIKNFLLDCTRQKKVGGVQNRAEKSIHLVGLLTPQN